MLPQIYSQSTKWFQFPNVESRLTVNPPRDDLIDQHQTAASFLLRVASHFHESTMYYVFLSTIEVFETQISQRTKESLTRSVAASVRWNRIAEKTDHCTQH